MRTITFYSYKGGTGRTLLVANMAMLAARLGKHVVTVDLDLEAPGLSYKLLGAAPESDGVLGWLRTYGTNTHPNVDELLIKVDVTNPFDTGGSLNIIPAGPPPSIKYLEWMRDLQSGALADEESAVASLLELRNEISSEISPDLLLIDARTGITTTNAVTTRVLADEVVALTLDTQEQLDGTRAVLRSLAPLTKPNVDEPLTLHVAVSRIPGRQADVGSYEWTDIERGTLARVAEFLRAPTYPLSTIITSPQMSLLHNDSQVARRERILMSRVEALDSTALHVDYLRLAAKLFGDEFQESVSAAITKSTSERRSSTEEFFAKYQLPDDARTERSDEIDRNESNAKGKPLPEVISALEKQLAAKSSPQVLIKYASAVSRLSRSQRDVGDFESARINSQHAVESYRQLTGSDSKYFPKLANSLKDLGRSNSMLGQYDEAVASLRESVQIYRQINSGPVPSHPRALSYSLGILGIYLRNLEQYAEAVEVGEESVALLRPLVIKDWEAESPRLARTLSILAIHYTKIDRLEDAITVSEEVVEIYRKKSESVPNDFASRLADSLRILAARYSLSSRDQEALRAAEESVTLFRKVLLQDAEEGMPKLARGLSDLGMRFVNFDMDTEATTATEEAVELYRILSEAEPDPYLDLLAQSLTNLGLNYLAEERASDAVVVAEEAREIRHEVGDSRDRGLARTLEVLVVSYALLGRAAECEALAEQVVEIYRSHADPNEPDLMADLAGALDRLSFCYQDMGNSRGALRASSEAAGLYRSLTMSDPGRFIPDLADSLETKSLRHFDMGDLKQATQDLTESVTLYRQLTIEQPSRFLAELAGSLARLAHIHGAAGNSGEAESLRNEETSIRVKLLETESS